MSVRALAYAYAERSLASYPGEDWFNRSADGSLSLAAA